MEIEHRREEIVEDIRQAEEAFQAGYCRPVTPDELMEEILDERHWIDSNIPF